MNRFLTKALRILFMVMMIWTVFLLVGFHEIANVYTSRHFFMEDGGFLIIGCAVVYLLYRWNKRAGARIEAFLQKHHRILLILSLAVLLAWQLYACFGGYFSTGWDAQILRETILYEVKGDYEAINNWYFPTFPNNIFLVWIYTQIVTIVDRTFGIGREYSMVAIQCLLDVCTVYLTYRIAFDIFHSYRASWLTYAVAYLFVGLSPWFIIVYSDATGIILPVFLIRLYQIGISSDSHSKRKSLVLFLMLGFFAMAGYYLKPQIFITAIAMALVSIPSLFTKRKTFRRTLRNLGAGILGAVMFLGIYHLLIVPSLHFNVDKERAISWPHYLMMGLNDSTDGVYFGDDAVYSTQFATRKERNAADLEVTRQRVSEYGFSGMVRHLSRKEIVNYGDGTFAWGVEGGFFGDIPSWANNRLSPLMHEILFPEGKLFMIVTSCQQLIWITILAMCMFAAKRKDDDELDERQEQVENVIFLALIGLTLFELLFEARARYLFCYAPLFVLTSILGVRKLFHFLNALGKSNQ